jgi:hypothetical protein
MQFEGAVIREQGITFAIVIVKPHIVRNTLAANDTIRSFMPAFPGLPVVLMAQDSGGRATYYGRQDISRFMARVPVRAVPWRRYSI